MPKSATAKIAVIGIDLGKNTLHLIGLDKRGAIVLRAKLSGRHHLQMRLASMQACLIGMEALASGGHHQARKLVANDHDAPLMLAKWVPPYPHRPADRGARDEPQRITSSFGRSCVNLVLQSWARSGPT